MKNLIIIQLNQKDLLVKPSHNWDDESIYSKKNLRKINIKNYKIVYKKYQNL